MPDPLAEKVMAIVAAQARCPVESLAPETSPQALGLDSLNLVEVVFAIEEAFDIRIPFNAQTEGPGDFDTSSIASVIEAVRGLVAAKPA